MGAVVSGLADIAGELPGNPYVLRCFMSNGFVAVWLLDFCFIASLALNMACGLNKMKSQSCFCLKKKKIAVILLG